MSPPVLHVVMYHYVRPFAESRFPGLKGMEIADFDQQIAALRRTFDVCTLERGLSFLRGEYTPKTDLCILSFDDGLREHYEHVTPVLRAHGVQGSFYVSTSSLEEHRVAAVHKNHHLLAELGIATYRREFIEQGGEMGLAVDLDVDPARVAATYRWDTPEVAAFKYLINFVLPAEVRDAVVHELFVQHFGDEASFARQLYLSWADAREMQRDGMLIGGHGHEHVPMTSLSSDERDAQLTRCRELLDERLSPQAQWPFSYPYGKPDSFDPGTIDTLRRLGFDCALASTVGANTPGADLYAISREDPKDM